MNIKRGLIRLWVSFSVLWILGVIGLTGQYWYHAASYWYRSRGFEAVACDAKQTEEVAERVSRAKADALGLKMPEHGPWEKDRTSPWGCFIVTVPKAGKYLVAVNEEKHDWSAEEIQDIALYNPQNFFGKEHQTIRGTALLT